MQKKNKFWILNRTHRHKMIYKKTLRKNAKIEKNWKIPNFSIFSMVETKLFFLSPKSPQNIFNVSENMKAVKQTAWISFLISLKNDGYLERPKPHSRTSFDFEKNLEKNEKSSSFQFFVIVHFVTPNFIEKLF